MANRKQVFDALRPVLPAPGFGDPRVIAAADALCEAAGIPRDDAREPMDMVALIDVSVLKAAAPDRDAASLAEWVEPIKRACRRFEMTTIRRMASFIAVFLAHESNLRPVNESLNYSVEALLSKFSRSRISEADARRLGRKPGEGPLSEERQRAIANILYGGEFGRKQLGNTQPNDGWDMRGTSAGQLTGRDNFTRFAAAMKMTLDQAISFARTVEGGVMAAAWFWDENDINRLADTPGVEDETRKINGGTMGLADRKARFDRTVAALIAREKAR